MVVSKRVGIANYSNVIAVYRFLINYGKMLVVFTVPELRNFMPSLVTNSLTFAYEPNSPVLQQVSLAVCSGEVLVLLGANGAGKSTLLRALAGQLALMDGQVLLEDRGINDWPRRDIAVRVALMPQFESTLTELSVREVVRLGRAPHRGWWLPLTVEDERIVDEALQAMSLTELQNRHANTLSGGQWRRMVLARALAQQAAILLLDEPTSGLDLKHQYDALEQVRRLARDQKISVALSLHDLNLACIFSDRIALMHQGSLIALGTPKEVITAENVRRAYEIPVSVLKHPQLDVPMVVPIAPSSIC